jgi:hypothetical protein
MNLFRREPSDLRVDTISKSIVSPRPQDFEDDNLDMDIEEL